MTAPLEGGAVVFTQWFGSMLQLTPHLHVLLPEGQWRTTSSGAQHSRGEAVEVAPPTDDDVAAVLARVLRQAKKDFAEEDAAWPEDEYEKGQRESLQRPLGLELPPTARRRRVAVAHGFSLHADTAVDGNDRQGLERLARYGARGPVAESRLRRLEDGRYEYLPKKGVSFVVSAEQLVRRLVSLVPPAKTHLTSFHGVYAPHAALRPLVTAPPPKPAPGAPVSSKKRRRPSRRLDWASLHQHTFGVDVLRCPCGGRRRIIAIHSTRKAAEERLTQLGHHLLPRRLLPPATAQPALPLAG